MATTWVPRHFPVPQFLVFFTDEIAHGMQPVEAPDAAAAEAVILDLNPDARVGAVLDDGVDAAGRHRLLAEWIRGAGLDGQHRIK